MRAKQIGDLTKNFSRHEFSCKCCDIDNIDPEFVNRLQNARDIAGIPFRINSGCRCPTQNAVVGGTYSSDHITTDFIRGHGADISCRDSHSRFLILSAAVKAGFTRIGLAKTYIHLGTSEENPQEVLWLY